MSLPWSKFYWSDWRSDPRLRMCGLAARGLWMEMLCLMHQAEPRGHLLVSGRAPTETQLAVLAGTPLEQLPDLLGELELTGVFSRTQKGVIYSRRMTRDEKKARTARKNGKAGGNPALCKTTENEPPDKGEDKGEDITQKLEARGLEEKERKKENSADALSDHPAMAFAGKVVRLNRADFETWRKAYSHLDIVAELTARDDWLSAEGSESHRKGWFHSTSRWLANQNDDARQKTLPKRTQLTPLGVGG